MPGGFQLLSSNQFDRVLTGSEPQKLAPCVGGNDVLKRFEFGCNGNVISTLSVALDVPHLSDFHSSVWVNQRDNGDADR